MQYSFSAMQPKELSGHILGLARRKLNQEVKNLVIPASSEEMFLGYINLKYGKYVDWLQCRVGS
jgi:hypothetical protein